MTQIRKFGGRIIPIVLQNIDQLTELLGPHGAATVLGNSGALLALAPSPVDNATAEFLSRAAGSHWVPEPSVSDDPQGGGRINWGMREQRLWSPEQIRSLPPFHGLVFMGGASPQPVWLPRYFVPNEFPELQGLYDPDPYHPASPASPTLRRVAKLTGITAAAAAVIGGGVWLSQAAGRGQIWHPNGTPVVKADDPPKAHPPAHVPPRKPPQPARR